MAKRNLSAMAVALREARDDLGLTQHGMGELADVSESTVLRWERGHAHIPVGRRLQLVLSARALNAKVAEDMARAFEVELPSPEAAATPSPPTIDLALRVDYAVLKGAERAELGPRVARAFAAAFLKELVESGASVAEIAAAVGAAG